MAQQLINPDENQNQDYEYFLGEPVKSNAEKGQFINEKFIEKLYFKEFFRIEDYEHDTPFEVVIRDRNKFMINFIFGVLNDADNEDIKLTANQLKQLPTISTEINNLYFSVDKLPDFLNSLSYKQLIYINHKILECDFYNIPYADYNFQEDKMFNINYIPDLYDDSFKQMIKENNPELSDADVQDKTKTDFVRDLYSEEQYYKNNPVNIQKYMELALTKTHNSNAFNYHKAENGNPNPINITSEQISKFINIISSNIDDMDKFKWFLYNLNYEQLMFIGI